MPSALEILRDPYLQVTYLFVTGVAAIYCLIGLWAATSRRHWFLRTIIPCLALAALIPIRAHEPLIFYALIMAEIIAAVTLWRWWRGRRDVGQVSNLSKEIADSGQVENLSYAGRFRFSLRDLLLLMVVVGVGAWIVTGFAGVVLLIEWPGAIVGSLLLAGLTIAAWNIVVSRRRVACALWLAAVFAVAVAFELLVLGDWLSIASNLNLFENIRYRHIDLMLTSFLYGEFTTLLLFATWLTRAAFWSSECAKWQVTARAVFAAAVLAAAVPLATLYWRMTGKPDFPPSVKLSENVLPQIIQIGAPMELAPAAQAKAIYQQLLPLLERSGYAAADEADVAQDPLSYQRLEKIQQLRCLARAIDREAEARHKAGKHDDAANYSLSVLKLAQMQSRGGLTIDVLVGAAVEATGRNQLARHRAMLSRESKAETLRLLTTLDAQRETIEVVSQRDYAYYARGMPWRFALERQIPFEIFGLRVSSEPHIDRGFADLCYRVQATSRLLFTDLAIRLFWEDHGRLPQMLDELAPEYLAAVPIDPYSDKPLVYRTDGDTFTLYSIGSDCQDNGGVTAMQGQNVYLTPSIDWDLDSLVAP